MEKSKDVLAGIQKVRELLDKEKRLKFELDNVVGGQSVAVYHAARALHAHILQTTGVSMLEEPLRKAVMDRAKGPPEKAPDCPLAGHSGTTDSCKECV